MQNDWIDYDDRGNDGHNGISYLNKYSANSRGVGENN